MIAMLSTRCPCCGADASTTHTWSATASGACLWCRFDQKTTEDYAAIDVELARLRRERLQKENRERRLIRATG
ncbi:hypothetical protein LCGC14_1706820, partial [marine sediment metagenome]